MANLKSFIHGNTVLPEHAGGDVFINIDGINNTDTLGFLRSGVRDIKDGAGW